MNYPEAFIIFLRWQRHSGVLKEVSGSQHGKVLFVLHRIIYDRLFLRTVVLGTRVLRYVTTSVLLVRKLSYVVVDQMDQAISFVILLITMIELTRS